MYSLYEYNKAGHMKVIREEGREEGLEKGLEKGRSEERARIISSMLSKGKSPEEIAELCNCSEDEVKALVRNTSIDLR